ncbi:cystathionine gamma-synthase [Flexivirga endophytica]|uniref:homocysteine desulfhydrase n=1 Tax=Flexivirga endophytica TaxID=1849103 RepID=A0A916WRD5_9MICO|nr:PLP-dependent transferase [Flexivirga endophytica]GGB25515.1 cystathionine gamma-synthase [Flexivirga endophytica]GHB54088.1 cystathionine gamma-synthase [Flexivirga endophytica]
MTTPPLQLDSIATHAGREGLAEQGVHVPSIDLSTTNPVPDLDASGLSYETMAGGGRPVPGGGSVYARLWNPTVARFEDGLAALEGTAEAVAFSSGMAAMTAVILAAKSEHSGRHVVAVRPLYGGTDHLLGSPLLDVETTYCAPSEVADAVRPDTCLVVVETPANPTLELVDIAAITAAAGSAPVVVDNTFATPVLQNPARFGAALVLHSATKFIGGHGDAIAGVVATSTPWAEALRRVRAITGSLLHPMGGYLLHRGLATLPLRVRAGQASADKLVGWASDHPAISQVLYPGLPECDPAGLVGRQMRGPGAMFALRLTGGYAAAAHLVSSVRLFEHAVSLGGVTSLISHPASLTHRPVPADARPDAGVVRLSIGLEDVEDLRADLEQALRAR